MMKATKSSCGEMNRSPELFLWCIQEVLQESCIQWSRTERIDPNTIFCMYDCQFSRQGKNCTLRGRVFGQLKANFWSIHAIWGAAEPTLATMLAVLMILPRLPCFFMLWIAYLQPHQTPLTFILCVKSLPWADDLPSYLTRSVLQCSVRYRPRGA